MEILYLTSEQYVRQQLPLGHRLLIRVSEQVVTHLRARVDDNWFAAHSLPKPRELTRPSAPTWNDLRVNAENFNEEVAMQDVLHEGSGRAQPSN